MIQIVRKDVGIKTVSFLFAILLWLFVLNNIDNPFQSKKMDVTITYLNMNTMEDKKIGLVNTEFDKIAQIEVRGRKDKMVNFTATDIEVTVDFNLIKDSGIKELPMKIKSKKSGVEVSLIKPKNLTVQVDKIVQKSIPVQVIQSGNPKENYRITKVTPVPESIIIEGVESRIKLATMAKVTIDVSNISKSLVLQKDCKIYGANDEELLDLNKNTAIDINVDIAKEVRINANIKGRPSKDSIITGSSLNKETILVAGFPELLENLHEIETDPVNVENISKTTEILTQIKVPVGLKIVNGDRELKITVAVEQLISKELFVKRENITMQNADDVKYKYEITPETVRFIVKGRQKDVAALDASKFKFSADLTGLSEGTIKVPLNISSPNNDIDIVEKGTVEIKVINKQPPLVTTTSTKE